MPDDERPGGTRSSAHDQNGYGRRHRRAADEPSEQPRRRRRSMEDGQGGLSVADLVQRHGTSRHDLSHIPADPPGRRGHSRPVESQPGGRSPGYPEEEGYGRAAPGQGSGGQLPSPGRRVPPSAPGHHADNGYGPPGDDYGPADGGYAAGGRRVVPANGYGPGDAGGYVPDNGYGPAEPGYGEGGYGSPNAGYSNGFDNGYGSGYDGDYDGGYGAPADDYAGGPDRGLRPGGPDNGYGPAGPADGGYRGGGRADGGFGPGVPDGGFGPAGDYGPGGPADGGYRGGPADNGYGPNGFGPSGPADDYGPAGNGYGGAGPAVDDFGPPARDRGFRAEPPANGFDPAVPANGYAPADDRIGPDVGYGPGRDPGVAPAGPDDGFGPGFGPGQSTGHRPIPEGGFGPGQHSGPRPGPVVPGQGKVPPTGSGPRPVVPGPGQGTGNYPVPGQQSGGRGLPPGGRPVQPGPGQQSGGPALPPGGRPVQPGPGQGTGHRPIPEGGFGPGQQSGHHPVPPVPPAGPLPGDPAAFPPGDPAAGEGPPPPAARSGAEGGDRRPGEPAGKVPLPPPRNPADAISMTTEMEAIGEEVQKRRGIDHTLARFSAVHDEIQAEERERKAKRRKLMPWRRQEDDEMDKLDELVAQQTLSAPQKQAQEQAQAPQEPDELEELLPPENAARPRERAREKPREKQPDRPNRSRMAIRVAAATAAILIFVATGIAWGFKSWVDASSQQVDALDPNSSAIQDAAKQRGDENFLLVGSDTRAGAEAEDGVGDEKDIAGARSDTVMVAHIPANRERAVVVSFPRDLEVDRPECEGWDPKSGDYTGDKKPAAEQVKLNTAYQVGGPKCVTKLVQQLSGLMINHFVGIDFQGFKGMVDAVQGVNVCVERPLKDDVLGTIVPQAGKNVTLSGDEALNFVRARHVQGDLTSDYGRIQRQQRFLSSLLRKAMSSDVLLDPGKLTDFVNAFSKSTFGDNIGVDQMITLGQSLQGIEAGRVTFITVPTVGEANERGNEDLRLEDTKSLFRAIREDTPLPGETGGTQQVRQGLKLQQKAPVTPQSIKLQVLNGGNPTGGIAGSTADQLAEFGYQIVWVDAAPENVKSTVIKYAKGSEAQAQLVRSSVPDAELVEDPSLAGAIQLIIGPGFDGKVVAPGKGKPQPELPDGLATVNGGDVSCA